MKQIPCVFSIILMTVPTVYDEDDAWIDGIKFRWEDSFNFVNFETEDHDQVIEADNRLG